MFLMMTDTSKGPLEPLWVALGLRNFTWVTDPWLARVAVIIGDTWQWTPFVFVIVYARLQALPVEVFEAGAMDGASWFQRTRYLTLPLLVPAIVFAGVFRAIDAFRTFDLVYGLTNGGPVHATSTLSFEAFQNGFEFFRYGYASAIAYVMVVVLIILSTVTLRFVRLRGQEGV